MKLEEYERGKSKYCNEIENMIQEIEQLHKENKDINEIILRLKTTLEEYRLFKRKYRD